MIDTHFTREFGLLHPMVLAPFDPFSDWRLAAAVSGAGGLGPIHVGVPDSAALQACFQHTGEDAVGWGLDCARLAQEPALLDQLLGYRPRAILLSGGDPAPYVAQIHAAKVPVICRVDSVAEARRAIKAEVDILATHGNGGAGAGSGTRTGLSLLPEIADAIYASHTETLLLCSGGISDARSVAAALIMGADGVMMGTRLWGSSDSTLDQDQLDALRQLGGDDVPCWPSLQDSGAAIATWRGLDGPGQGMPMGEGVGMISDTPAADEILETLSYKAPRLMTHIRRKVVE